MTHEKDDDEKRSFALDRRAFMRGAGISAATAALLEARAAEGAAGRASLPVLGPGSVPITLEINGRAQKLNVEPSVTLAEALRNDLGLTGTKIGCDRGACGACTVHLDGAPVTSCMTLAIDAAGRKITTIEGLEKNGKLHPVQEAFIEHDAMQCGFCTPGMVMSCAALLDRNKKPTLDDVKAATSGNTCRCGTYPKVFSAALAASGQKVIQPPLVTATKDDRAGKGAPKRGTFPAGIAGADLATVDRELPADEPDPWPINAELSVIGRPTARLDGRLKVTGRAHYTADVKLPGMLYARRVASPHAHARIKSIDVAAAEKYPGVRAIHILERQRAGAQLRDPKVEPADKYPRIRYAGQPIAAVAATTQAAADEAARLIKIEYELLPFTVDLDDAMKPNAPLVFAGPTEQPGTAGGGGAPKGLPQTGNVRGPAVDHPIFGGTRGDVARGLKEADVVVEGEFRTQVQTHAPMETHGVVADWKPELLTVYASTQGTSTVRDDLADVFSLPKNKIRVITEFMGGGFGAKFGAGNYGVLAVHLSRKAGAPVRLMLDRKEEHLAVGNRPGTKQQLAIGAKKDGSLTAVRLESWGTGGISTGAGVGIVAQMMYPSPNFSSKQFDVFTHAGPSAAFRAPGAPQGVFAVEQLVDELAEKLGIDPLALREKIDVDTDKMIDSRARAVERRIGAEKIGWSSRHPPGAGDGPIKRGLGVAQSIWPRLISFDANVEVRLSRDGSVELYSAVQDIGGGITTALAMVVAEELGIKPQDVTVRIGDTNYPAGTPSGGSRTTGSMTPSARNAAYRVKKQLFERIAPELGVAPDALVLSGGKISVRGQPAKSMAFKKAAGKLKTDQISALANRSDDYGGFESGGKDKGFGAGVGSYGGVQFAAVAVDIETGVIGVERIVAVHDCGRPINPLGIQSQINGGVLQGLSYALYEQRILDRRSGRMLNANLEQYKIAGARETPEIDVVVIEEYRGRNATDAGGIGEPANVATAAAIANAVYNAIGVRMRAIPMTPARVLAALEQKRRTT